MTSAELTDDEKEVHVRRAGLDVLAGSWSMFWRIVACLIGALFPIYLADAFQLADNARVTELMLRFDYILQ